MHVGCWVTGRVRLPSGRSHRYRPPLVTPTRHRGTAVPARPGEQVDTRAPRGSHLPEDHAVKRTFQPNTRRRARKHGFRTRMRTRAGRAIVKARRLKGRRKLTA